MERAYLEIVNQRENREARLRQLLERYNIEVERAIKHGKPVPLSIEQAYLELTDPDLARQTKQTKSKVFPSTTNWPKPESPAKKRQQTEKGSPEVVKKPQEPDQTATTAADDPYPKLTKEALDQHELG